MSKSVYSLKEFLRLMETNYNLPGEPLVEYEKKYFSPVYSVVPKNKIKKVVEVNSESSELSARRAKLLRYDFLKNKTPIKSWEGIESESKLFGPFKDSLGKFYILDETIPGMLALVIIYLK